MKKILLIMFAAVALAACNNSEDSKKSAMEANNDMLDEHEKKLDIKDDLKFAANAADESMLEVRLGELAQRNAASQEVKNLGMMIASAHTKSNIELKSVADKKDITLPASLSKDAQDRYDDLAKKTGQDFDKAYCEKMAKAHEDAFDWYQKESDKGNDADIKSWAASKLSMLEHHKQEAEILCDKMK